MEQKQTAIEEEIKNFEELIKDEQGSVLKLKKELGEKQNKIAYIQDALSILYQLKAVQLIKEGE
jgi:peptidoglycan hydrolase CwlO-like protein